jgi:hypothetical protein
MGLAVLIPTLAVAGCGNESASSTPSPSATVGTTDVDLSVIACATDDPSDAGELTGAWQGDDAGVYYIRHVGDCLWWFGTEIRDVEPGVTGQRGFSNVASGRVDGTRIELEWADVPMGDILNGGGLTLMYDAQNDQLVITERRGEGISFGATVFTRIDPDASPEVSPNGSATP